MTRRHPSQANRRRDDLAAARVAEDRVFQLRPDRGASPRSAARRPLRRRRGAGVARRAASFALEHREHVGGVDDDAPAVLGFDQHLAGEDFLRQHAGPAVVRDDVGADRRQLALQVLVGVVLVAQAALEPAAAAGDLARVERRPLQLGHLHRDGRHLAEVRVAADRLAAVAVVGQQLGLVADADLPHFDPRLKLVGERLHEVAKVDAALGQVVDDDPLAAVQVLDVDQLHVEIELLDLALADFVLAPLLLEHLAQLALIVARHLAQDLALLGIDQLGDRFVGRFAQHFARFEPAAGAGDHLLAAHKRIATHAA